MNRDDIAAFHYITPIANVPSILELGILSHAVAEGVDHVSVASQVIQDKRSDKKVPGGRTLHEYANLYFTARNPMLYLRKELHETLCVVQVSPAVLDLDGVVITDGNASGDYTRFYSPTELESIDGTLVFAQYWTSTDQIDFFRRKSAKCAEVLVPDFVDRQLVQGAHVSCEQSRRALAATAGALALTVTPFLFFR